MTPTRRTVFIIVATAILGAAVAATLASSFYLFGVKHFHYTAVRPIFHLRFVRAYLFDWRFRRLVELMDEEDGQYDDVFASVWDTSEGTLLSRKMFHPVEMYGEQKYMYNPGLVKRSFTLEVDGFARSFSMVDSPALRRTIGELGATHVHTASYDSFGFRKADSDPGDRCDVRVMFLGDSFTDGVYMDDGETAVNRYGQLARERSGLAVCPINTGVDGYGTLEESFVFERYFESTGKPGIAIVMHFPNDVDVDENKVVDGAMADASHQWATSLQYLHRIAEFSRMHGAALVVAAIPLARQLANPSTRKNYQDVLRSFCESEGVPFVDLLRWLQPLDVHEIYLEGDPHWTARGHEAVAQILFEQTKDLLEAAARRPAATAPR
jgi:hypothetical protein